MTVRKTLSSKTVWRNEWYSVKKDKVIRPDGSEGHYYVINRAPTVVIIPWTNSNIYLVKQYRYALKQRVWELPMGTCEKNIALLENAKKELQEETGLTASKWNRVGKFSWMSGMSNQLAYVYLATHLRQGQTDREPEELDMDMKAFSLKEIEKMIKNSQIIDDGTITAIYQFKLFLNK